MRKLAAILIFGALGCGAGSLAADDISLVRGITLLKAGEKAKAYQLLESSFRENSDMGDRARSALMLALAEQKYVRAPRYVYAEYALRNYRNLESSMALKLTRIVGDGRFEMSDLDGAKRSFQFILASPTSSLAEKEYATYKLGWIYMNENGPERAFRLWQNWLEQDAQGELREAILRDAGQAWAEATLSGKQPSLRLKLAEPAAERAFYAGVIGVVEARQAGQGLGAILAALASNHIYASFLNYALEQSGDYLAKRPCDGVEWLGRAEASAVNAASARRVLEACQKRIDKKQEPDSDRKLRLLADAYARYSTGAAVGKGAQAAATNQFGAGEFDKACVGFATAAVELARKGKSLAKVPGAIERTRLACVKTDGQEGAQRQALRELTETVLASRGIAREFRAKPDALYRQVLGLAQLKGMREVALQQLVRSQDVWRDSSLPSAFLKDWEGDMQSQLALLNAYLRKGYAASLRPGFAVVVTSLLRAGRASDARELLYRYVPVEKAATLGEIGLWVEYIERDSAQRANFELYRELSRAAVRLAAAAGAQQNRDSRDAETRRTALAGIARLALHHREARFLAEHQLTFESALLADAESLRAFLRAGVFDPAVGAALAKARSGQIAGYVQSARAVAAGKADASDRTLLRNAQAAIARTDLHADILKIDAMRIRLEGVAALKGANPAALAVRIAPIVESGDASLTAAKKHRWSSEEALTLARSIHAETNQTLASLLETLPKGARVGGRDPRELAQLARKAVLE